MRVRFRVDGVLYEAARVPKRMVAGRGLAREDHERARHRREARAAGRPRQRQRRGPQGRPARHDPADPARRGGDDPHPRQGAGPAHARRARHGRRPGASASRPRSPGPTAPSWSPGRPARASRRRSTRRSRSSTRSRRTSSRSRTRSSTGSTGINQINVNRKAGLDLRHRPALDPARRPRHHHGRRDPRRRDRADRDRGGADRPHGALDPAHQRRPGRDRAAGEDGDRELPDRLGGRLRRRPAAGAQALHALQAAHGDPAGRRCRRPGFRVGADLEAYEPVGCARCNQTGYGPDRALLGDGDERADQGADRRAAPPRPRSPRSPARRACSPCARTACARSAPASPRSRRSLRVTA